MIRHLFKTIGVLILVSSQYPLHSCSCKETKSGYLEGRLSNRKIEEKIEFVCDSESSQSWHVKYKAYSASFNPQTLTANWVAYELTADHTDGPYSRKGYHFVQDPDCHLPQADDADYKGSGYSRGHLVPAGDMKWDGVAMQECFFFTNCIPQDTKFNNGKWNQLEERTRRLAKEYGVIYVVCGPIYEQRDTVRIGDNGVAVPHKCFKALMVPKNDTFSCIGFIMSNGGEEREVMDCACTVDSLESVIGIDLFCNLPDKLEKVVESEVIWEDWREKCIKH